MAGKKCFFFKKRGGLDLKIEGTFLNAKRKPRGYPKRANNYLLAIVLKLTISF